MRWTPKVTPVCADAGWNSSDEYGGLYCALQRSPLLVVLTSDFYRFIRESIQ